MPISRLRGFEIRRAQRKSYDRLRRWEVKRVENFIRNNPSEGTLLLPGFGVSLPIPLPGDLITTVAAFGLRKLNSNYSGFCLRVKRSSDNATQDIGFAGTRLDVSALTSFVGGATALLDTWYDQSGNGHNLTPVASNNPVIKKVGNVYTADFTDNLAAMQNTDSLTIASFFAVANHAGETPFSNFNGLLSSVSGSFTILRGELGGTLLRSNGGTDGLFGNNVFVNGVQTKQFAPLSQTKLIRGFAASTSTISGLTVGRDTNDNQRIWKGQISEVILGGVLTTQNFTDVESALNTYFQLY